MATYRRNADRDDDDISLISMQELAPSPIFYDGNDDDYDTASAPTTPTHQMHLVHPTPSPPPSASPRHRIPPHRKLTTWLTRTQKYSSYVFSGFLGIHGATAALSPLVFGVDAGNASIVLARTYFYQSYPLVEALLVPGSLAVHVSSGLALRILRRRQQTVRYGGSPPASISPWRWQNLTWTSITGWAAIPFVAAHAALLRGIPLYVDGDSSQIGLEYLGHGFNHGRWVKLAGYAFYGALAGLMSYHVVYGWSKYWQVSTRRRNALRSTALGAAGVWLGGVAVVASSGPVRGYLGRHYDHLYRVFFRRV